jgi:hypothetical protein
VRRPEGGLEAEAGSGTAEREVDPALDQDGCWAGVPARAGPQSRAQRGARCGEAQRSRPDLGKAKFSSGRRPKCGRSTLDWRVMRNRVADAFERGQRSRACLEGSHARCPHSIGQGGGMNLRRLRFEFGTELCKCPCHAACPISGRQWCVADQVWRDGCTCPGAPALRARLEQSAMNPRPPYEPYAPRHTHGERRVNEHDEP